MRLLQAHAKLARDLGAGAAATRRSLSNGVGLVPRVPRCLFSGSSHRLAEYPDAARDELRDRAGGGLRLACQTFEELGATTMKVGGGGKAWSRRVVGGSCRSALSRLMPIQKGVH